MKHAFIIDSKRLYTLRLGGGELGRLLQTLDTHMRFLYAACSDPPETASDAAVIKIQEEFLDVRRCLGSIIEALGDQITPSEELVREAIAELAERLAARRNSRKER